MSTLDGATNEPAPYTQISNAGEFAAMWNHRTPAQREEIWKQIKSATEDGHRCFIEDHDGLKELYGKATEIIGNVLRYADDRKAHARSTKLNTLSSWRVWSDLYQILGLSTTEKKD